MCLSLLHAVKNNDAKALAMARLNTLCLSPCYAVRMADARPAGGNGEEHLLPFTRCCVLEELMKPSIAASMDLPAYRCYAVRNGN